MNQSSPYYAYGHPLHIFQEKKRLRKKNVQGIKLTFKLLRNK